MEAVTGHHGHIKFSDWLPDLSLPLAYDQRLAKEDRRARMEWVSALENIFLLPAGLSLKDIPLHCPSIMAGFCSVVDWLGSRCDEENFSYHQEPKPLKSYFIERFNNDAVKILDLAGIIGRSRPYTGIASLLEPERKPRSLQTLVDCLPLNAGLTLIEAPTGSGKTETALAYAWRIIEAGLAESIIFALPTQASANAMLGRIERLALLLFEKHPNVVLAHGSARFNQKFVALKHAALEGLENEDGWIQCSAWLAESRKRVFLGQIGVCTVDQVLISVLPVRHWFVRGFGVGRSVLIIDEVHAYDAYMYGLLEEVLRKQSDAGGSAILLSATLPEFQRRQLLSAWEAEIEESREKAPYPLVTWSNGLKPRPFTLDESQLPSDLTVKLKTIIVEDMLPDESLIQRIVDAADQGAQVAVVCNLVDVAQKLVRKLRERTSVSVSLFHARFCYKHRQEKELAVIEQFGPKGKRDMGRVLIATQVVEQSLDLDFDWLITQLCPVDLLFQRMGRLHRHDRPVRPSGFERPLCTVLIPNGLDYGSHGLIYANSRLLWRTSQKVLTAPGKQVVFPHAYRDWIESVYQEDPWGDEPEEIQKGYEKFKDEVESVKRYKARYIIDTKANPFTDTDQRVTALTRDGEMNLTLVPYGSTSEGRMLVDGTIYETLGELQQFEALTLNSMGVPKSWRHYLNEPDPEGRFWFEMERDGDVFKTTSKGVTFRYHKDMGMEKEK